MSVKVSVTSSPKNRVSIKSQKISEVRTVGVIPEQPANKIINMSDVDTTNLSNNTVLVYDSSVGKFVLKEWQS